MFAKCQVRGRRNGSYLASLRGAEGASLLRDPEYSPESSDTYLGFKILWTTTKREIRKM